MRLFSAFVLAGMVYAATPCAQPHVFAGELTGVAPVAAADPARAAWQDQQKAAEVAAAEALKTPSQPSKGIQPGQVGPGDKLKLTVFGEEDLSGQFEIDTTGSLALPLVGEVKATGLTPRELEKKLTDVLSKGYLVNPRVNIEVMNFRPFFILGEVSKPGSYPYVNDMTVINAIALGGGYTPRAKTGQVKLRRADDPSHTETWVNEETKIYPGDVIQVDERFF